MLYGRKMTLSRLKTSEPTDQTTENVLANEIPTITANGNAESNVCESGMESRMDIEVSAPEPKRRKFGKFPEEPLLFKEKSTNYHNNIFSDHGKTAIGVQISI